MERSLRDVLISKLHVVGGPHGGGDAFDISPGTVPTLCTFPSRPLIKYGHMQCNA